MKPRIEGGRFGNPNISEELCVLRRTFTNPLQFSPQIGEEDKVILRGIDEDFSQLYGKRMPLLEKEVVHVREGDEVWRLQYCWTSLDFYLDYRTMKKFMSKKKELSKYVSNITFRGARVVLEIFKAAYMAKLQKNMSKTVASTPLTESFMHSKVGLDFNPTVSSEGLRVENGIGFADGQTAHSTLQSQQKQPPKFASSEEATIVTVANGLGINYSRMRDTTSADEFAFEEDTGPSSSLFQVGGVNAGGSKKRKLEEDSRSSKKIKTT